MVSLDTRDHRYFGLSVDYNATFYVSEPVTLGLACTLHYTVHCINAIILIIIVIYSPPREDHYPGLPPP